MKEFIEIREYKDEDEIQWIKCRLLSFLDTSYFDDIQREKGKYENPSICLVAEDKGNVVGFIDVEYENNIGDVCYLEGDRGATIWHLGVLPEYRNKGVATQLYINAKNLLLKHNICRIEVWTQDDIEANEWYRKQGFVMKEAYLNAFIKGTEQSEVIKRFVNIDKIGEVYGVRNFNFEAPINRKEELSKICYRLHEVRVYEVFI